MMGVKSPEFSMRFLTLLVLVLEEGKYQQKKEIPADVKTPHSTGFATASELYKQRMCPQSLVAHSLTLLVVNKALAYLRQGTCFTSQSMPACLSASRKAMKSTRREKWTPWAKMSSYLSHGHISHCSVWVCHTGDVGQEDRTEVPLKDEINVRREARTL